MKNISDDNESAEMAPSKIETKEVKPVPQLDENEVLKLANKLYREQMRFTDIQSEQVKCMAKAIIRSLNELLGL